MADNVLVTPGTGKTMAADEVVDGTLGTVAVGFGKIMDGTLDSTNKLIVSSAGAAKVDGSAVTQPVSAASLPLPSGAATSANQTTTNTSVGNIDTNTGAIADASVAAGATGSVSAKLRRLTTDLDAVKTSNSTVATNTTLTSTDFFPQYNRNDTGGSGLHTNPAGQLSTESYIITDAGSVRANFTGSALTSTLGTCTFTNGSQIVTGSGFANSSVEVLSAVKIAAHAESALNQVYKIDSDTQLTLLSPYTGATTTGAATYQPLATVTGTGGSFAVASGQMTMTCGTTAGATHLAYGVANTGDLEIAGKLALSQRIANQDIFFGLEDNALTTISSYSRFRFNGTTNTTVICETAYNPTTTPSASEVELTTMTIPGSLTTATANIYKILVTQDQVTFSINGIVVANHTQRIPHIRRTSNTGFTTLDLRCLNGTTPASSTVVTSDYITGRIYNRIDTYQGTPVADNGSDGYFMDVVTTTVTPTSQKGRLMGVTCINLNSTPSYIQVFDTTGAVTLGTTVPRYVIPIPANATAANGAGIVAFTANGLNIVNGIKIACTTGPKNATTVTTGLSGTLLYRNL